jgi:uncharacterized membrane protein YkgB
MKNLEAIDKSLTKFFAKYGIPTLRIALGIIFFWFGVLKFFPGLSSAENLALRTIHVLTFGHFSDLTIRIGLASLETLIGLGLIFGIFLRTVLFLLFFQMLGTFSPLVLFPSESFQHLPFVPTLEGQYIIKNIVLISAAMVVGATVRGGKIVVK